MTNAQPVQLRPEMLVPRLGDYLVSKGYLSELDLQKALSYQQEMIAQGRVYLLGQAIVDLQLLGRESLDQAVTEQIIQLRNALQATNRSLEERVQQRTAELQEALARLSELNQLKANFISNISHELRTPLTHVKGYVELLASESLGPLTEEQKHALKVSQQSTNKLENLIDDLIMFSLASRGELSLRQESLDLTRLASLAVKAVEQKGRDRNVSVHEVVDKDLPPVQADSQKIAWALGQLLDNAIKFTPSEGRVALNIHRESKNIVMISITDTGIGIPPARLTEIFEPFHQLDSSSTRKYGGTGIGLALVRQIVEAHGSMLEVISVEGKGATFRFPLLVLESTSAEA